MKRLAPFLTLILVLMLTGCNLPASQPAPSPTVIAQVATIVAATMQAAGSTATPVTPSASPVPPPETPTTQPTLTISASSASCRGGPGTNFKEVAQFPAGTKLTMVGKDTADGYWIVLDPTSHDLCWIQAPDATASGSYVLLPEVTPPASASNVPARPTITAYAFECVFAAGGGLQVKVDLSWADKSNNETGYHIYRNDTQVADLPANATTYSETADIASGTVYVYSVEAYNTVGASPRAVTRGDAISC